MEGVKEQIAVCAKHNVTFTPTNAESKVGIAQNARDGQMPLNGLRLEAESGTTGWFIWAGEELSTADDFFVPIHAKHLPGCCPQVMKYLGLPPGWRFMIAVGHEDVWFDAKLLEK